MAKDKKTIVAETTDEAAEAAKLATEAAEAAEAVSYVDQDAERQENELTAAYENIAINANVPEITKVRFAIIKEAKDDAKTSLRNDLLGMFQALKASTGKDVEGERLPSHDSEKLYSELSAGASFPNMFESEELQRTRHAISESVRPFNCKSSPAQFDTLVKSVFKDLMKKEASVTWGAKSTPEKVTGLIKYYENKNGFSYDTRGQLDQSYVSALTALHQIALG